MGTRTVAAMAIVAAIVDLILIAVVLLAASDVDQLTAPMSAHVDDRFGFLTGVSAFSAGVGALALACAARPFITGARAALGLALLGIFGVAKVFQAFFPLDAADAATTAAGHHSSFTIARPPGLAARTMSTCIIAAHTPTRSIDALTPLCPLTLRLDRPGQVHPRPDRRGRGTPDADRGGGGRPTCHRCHPTR